MEVSGDLEVRLWSHLLIVQPGVPSPLSSTTHIIYILPFSRIRVISLADCRFHPLTPCYDCLIRPTVHRIYGFGER